MIKSLLPKLAEIGKIKIGGVGEKRKAASGRDYRLPIKFGHFVITKTEKDQHGNFIINKEIMEKLGPKPMEIKIELLYDNLELNFLSRFNYYHGHKCFCKGNGEVAERLTATGKKIIVKKKQVNEYKYKEIVCPAGECEFLINNNCKPSGLLSVILPQANNIGGVFKFRTTSWNSISNIQSALAFIKTQTGGKLAGIPLKLQLMKKATNEHGNVDVCNIVFDGDSDQLKKAVIDETTRRENFKIDILKLEDSAKKIGITDDNDDPIDVEEEFYPDETITNATKSNEIDADQFSVPAPTEVIESKEASDIEKENKDKSVPDLL